MIAKTRQQSLCIGIYNEYRTAKRIQKNDICRLFSYPADCQKAGTQLAVRNAFWISVLHPPGSQCFYRACFRMKETARPYHLLQVFLSHSDNAFGARNFSYRFCCLHDIPSCSILDKDSLEYHSERIIGPPWRYTILFKKHSIQPELIISPSGSSHGRNNSRSAALPGRDGECCHRSQHIPVRIP